MTSSEDGHRAHSIRSRQSFAADALPPPVHFYSLRIPNEQLQQIRNKKVKQFYQNQNAMIDRYLQVDHVVEAMQRGQDPMQPLSQTSTRSVDQGDDEESRLGSLDGMKPTERQPLLADHRKQLMAKKQEKKSPVWVVTLAINLSFAVNVLLFITKLLLAIFSGSIAILASAFESFLDILSNAIIYLTILLMQRKDYYGYPVGKARMEPLGIIVFAVVITTSFSQVLITSIERLTDPEKMSESLDLSPLGLGLLAANIVIKAILWAWCSSIKNSPSVQVLGQDHGNDVVFNLASTIFPVLAVWAKSPWLDPVGGIVLSLYIIYEWMNVLLQNITRLTGKAASPDDLKQLTYMAYRFSRKITCVDTVRAYHVGDRLLVEVDIVLPPDCPLREAHDVGESLQDAFEMMDNVERAFVHLDYDPVHAIEHRRAGLSR